MNEETKIVKATPFLDSIVEKGKKEKQKRLCLSCLWLREVKKDLWGCNAKDKLLLLAFLQFRCTQYEKGEKEYELK